MWKYLQQLEKRDPLHFRVSFHELNLKSRTSCACTSPQMGCVHTVQPVGEGKRPLRPVCLLAALYAFLSPKLTVTVTCPAYALVAVPAPGPQHGSLVQPGSFPGHMFPKPLRRRPLNLAVGVVMTTQWSVRT